MVVIREEYLQVESAGKVEPQAQNTFFEPEQVHAAFDNLPSERAGGPSAAFDHDAVLAVFGEQLKPPAAADNRQSHVSLDNTFGFSSDGMLVDDAPAPLPADHNSDDDFGFDYEPPGQLAPAALGFAHGETAVDATFELAGLPEDDALAEDVPDARFMREPSQHSTASQASGRSQVSSKSILKSSPLRNVESFHPGLQKNKKKKRSEKKRKMMMMMMMMMMMKKKKKKKRKKKEKERRKKKK